MPHRLYLKNSLTGRKEAFLPFREGKKVSMFTCGPSIYSYPHIGNFRTFLFEDVLQRYLDYLGYEVDRLINFTDVEDKAIAEANKRKVSLQGLTRPVAKEFFNDCRLLRIQLPATAVCRSSASVQEAVAIIRRLIDKGIAYRHGKNIYYDPLKFKDFGKLFGLDMGRWPKKKVRYHRDTYPGHRWNLGDFILWKGWKEDEDGDVFWDTELGRGRPSWNVQDPAMIAKHLGPRIDISCGGIDNLYRHHDYNIAVMEGAFGQKFAGYWLHGEHVLVNGVKMAKSRGNIIYVKDLIGLGYRPRHIRFYLVYGHYRKRIHFREDRLLQAREKADLFRDRVRRLLPSQKAPSRSVLEAGHRIERMKRAFEAGMNDDLNVEAAFDGVFQELPQLARLNAEKKLSRKDAQLARKALERMDGVWKIL